MVVNPIPPATASSPADPYLIADQGQRYHLTDKKATSALGLVDGYQVPFPRALLQRMTSGPDLAVDAITTSAAAGQPVPELPAAQHPATPGNVQLKTLKPPPPSAGVSSEPGR